MTPFSSVSEKGSILDRRFFSCDEQTCITPLQFPCSSSPRLPSPPRSSPEVRPDHCSSRDLHIPPPPRGGPKAGQEDPPATAAVTTAAVTAMRTCLRRHRRLKRRRAPPPPAPPAGLSPSAPAPPGRRDRTPGAPPPGRPCRHWPPGQYTGAQVPDHVTAHFHLAPPPIVSRSGFWPGSRSHGPSPPVFPKTCPMARKGGSPNTRRPNTSL